MAIRLSELDAARWGVRTAIATDVGADDVPAQLAFCRERAVRLAIARCDAADHAAAHALEQAGFLLMDTLVYFERGVTELSHARTEDVRPARADDAAEVQRVAAEAFAGYDGHYHADERLDARAADGVYVDWAVRAVTGELADEVLLAEREGRVEGFAALRLNRPAEAEIVLNAVAPGAQRRGLYGGLLAAAVDWSRRRRATRLVVSTQLANVAVQRSWTRAGFEPLRALHTFHAWL